MEDNRYRISERQQVRLREMLSELFKEYTHKRVDSDYVMLSRSPEYTEDIEWERYPILEFALTYIPKRLYSRQKRNRQWLSDILYRAVIIIMAERPYDVVDQLFAEFKEVELVEI